MRSPDGREFVFWGLGLALLTEKRRVQALGFGIRRMAPKNVGQPSALENRSKPSWACSIGAFLNLRMHVPRPSMPKQEALEKCCLGHSAACGAESRQITELQAATVYGETINQSMPGLTNQPN